MEGKWNSYSAHVRNIPGLAVCSDGWKGVQRICINQEGERNGFFFYRSNVHKALSDFRFTAHCFIACGAFATRAEGGRWDSSVHWGVGWEMGLCLRLHEGFRMHFWFQFAANIGLKRPWKKRCGCGGVNIFSQIKNCQIYFIQTNIWLCIFLMCIIFVS